MLTRKYGQSGIFNSFRLGTTAYYVLAFGWIVHTQTQIRRTDAGVCKCEDARHLDFMLSNK